tara:strand:+ start:481 stop:1470 length:990 start_codon:yes stop_codon:yes gene_type:complete
MYKYREIDKELAIFAKNGDKTVKDVMDEYDLNPAQAKSRLKKLNLEYINIRKPQKIKESHLIIIGFIKKEKRTILEIMDKFNISDSRTRYIIKKYGLTYNKLTNKEFLRNEQILKLLVEDDKTYEEIGNIYGISKQRIRQLAYKSNFKRYAIRKVKYTEIAKEILLDIKLGMLYSEIREKYTYAVIRNVCSRGLLSNLYTDFISKRNTTITKKYKETIARKIIESSDSELLNPNKINGLSNIYRIACEDGFKRYPKIGNRNKGGTFEDKKILRYITKKRDKDGWSFRRITDKLQRLGHKTLTGKVFDTPNVYYKYNAYKKNKYKRVSYD